MPQLQYVTPAWQDAGMVDGASTQWSDRETAAAYRRFAAAYPKYRETSHDLVSRARLEDARLVVDLCSGTGATTDAILDVLSASGRVLAVDRSAAMQAEARNVIHDPRVRYVVCSAEEFDRHAAEPVDAVVCNSAIWQTEMPATFAAARRALAPGGRLVFNVGGRFVRLPPVDQPARRTPSLFDLVRQYVILGPRPDRSPEMINQWVRDAGLVVAGSEVVAYESTVEEDRAWLSIPIIAGGFSTVPYAQWMDILEKAHQKVDKDRKSTIRWLVVTAEVR